MKIITVILLSFIVVTLAHAQILPGGGTAQPYASNLAAPDSTVVSLPKKADSLKKPAIALGLSILVPGAGQVYNGQVAKGVVFAGMFYGGVALLNQAKMTKAHSSITVFGWMSIILTAGVDVCNFIDAATTADRLSESASSTGRGLNLEMGGHRVDVDFALKSHSPGVALSVSF